ncbi:MAG: hypothetical protein LBQ86_05360 [Holophagales bacterium]|jgi:hypothetical protein|nr:hypothetical protein [Holophagales bacterium]
MRKVTFYTTIALAALIAAFMGCGKKDSDVKSGVFVAGTENGFATLWVNGVAQRLGNGISPSAANSVFVYGNDVYVAGHEKKVATLWKNGMPQRIKGENSTSSSAASVFVSEGDVYVAGHEQDNNNDNHAILWKNGVTQRLSGEGSSRADSVFVSGNDVYVTGESPSNEYDHCAKLWKNGVEQRLGYYISYDGRKNFVDGYQAASVFVSGSDVYVAGGEGVPSLWKNGVKQDLKIYFGKEKVAASVFVSGGDVYVAGCDVWSGWVDPVSGEGWRNATELLSVSRLGKNSENSVYIEGTFATLWKNGVPQLLVGNTKTDNTNTDGNRSWRDEASNAAGVFVSGDDVYVAGYEKNAQGKSIAALWKNGVAQSLSDGSNDAVANSVFVK